MHKHILWITRTAIFTALLIVTQAATAALGNQFVTGSAVNLILIVATMTCGLPSGLTVAVISPIFATLLGIGPQFPPIIPVMMLGNSVLVVAWGLIGNRDIINKHVARIIALIVGALAKYLVLYFGVVHIAIPLFMDLPPERAIVISGIFSVPQLITASIGGAIAVVILPMIKKAIRQK
jgi:hypothetical protein